MRKPLFAFASLIIMLTVLVAFINIPGRQHKQMRDDFIIDTLATRLTVPWAMVFIDKETLLFTERNGKVRQLRKNQLITKPVLIVGIRNGIIEKGMPAWEGTLTDKEIENMADFIIKRSTNKRKGIVKQ